MLRLSMLGIAAVIVTALFILGAQPVAVGLFLPAVDKLAHAGVFGILALLCWLGFNRSKVWLVFVIVALIGVMDETHQLFLPGRTGDLYDLAADLTAAGLVLLLLNRTGERELLRRD